MRTARFRLSALLVACALTAGNAHAQIKYVDANLTTGLNDGTSWANAYRGTLGLQVALQSHVGLTWCWVARGTYVPSVTGDRNATFQLDDGDEIYGGFAGGETSLAERDIAANPTILSGDLGGDDGLGIVTDNSLHVITFCPGWEDSEFRLYDCTISAGRADGLGADAAGGALLVNCGVPRVEGCTITGCTAGPAVSITGGFVNTSTSFARVRFEDNLCEPVHVEGSAALLRFCAFLRNTATAGAGAVGCANAGFAQLSSCIVVDNRGTTASAVFASTGSATLTDCTVVGNEALSAGVAAAQGVVNVRSSILYFNLGSTGTQLAADQYQGVFAEYSCIQGGAAGTGNITSSPRFVDLANGDLRLDPFSPCIDAGRYRPAQGSVGFDFLGASHLVDDPVTFDTGFGFPVSDMGAFEFPPTDSRAFCSGDAAPTHHTTACPCANSGAVGRGCASSAVASGALLVAEGTPAADDIVLDASDMPASAFTLFLQHDALDDRVFHDGVACAGGTLLRLRPRGAVGGAARFPDANFPQDATLTLSQRGGVTVGSGAVRYYSVFYRNASSTFCPPATANVTNGWRITW